jgi:hypothetical protein
LYHFSKSARALAAAAGAVALCTSIALAQADVSVTLNGAPLNLNPAPQERAGRVFVPLRGVFEQLGASVVYENGTINAQGRGNRSVSLHIGSTQATVDGQPQTMDVAPFIIGASTYVPLRFVSQALGASVNYDASNRIVALGNAGPGQQQGPPQAPPPRAMQPPPPQTPQRSPLVLNDVQPGRDQAVAARRPTIEAQFAAAQANPNSIRIELDGLNVTDQASRSPRGVVFSPPSDLQSGKHEVRIVGTDMNGMPFDGRWTFASGTSTVVNSITDVRPGNGTSVHDQFVVSGHTMPGARVVVQVGTVDHPRSDNVIGQLFGGNGGSDSVRSEVTADGSGNFQTPIVIPAHPGQGLTLVVDSTDAQTRSAAPRVVRNLTAD